MPSIYHTKTNSTATQTWDRKQLDSRLQKGKGRLTGTGFLWGDVNILQWIGVMAVTCDWHPLIPGC